MGKSNYYFGQNTLGQVLKLIPPSIGSKVVKQTGSDLAVKKFSTINHLYTMCYAVLADVTGLRHVCDGLLAMGEKLRHIGLDYVVPKSTLSDSNKNNDSEVFGQIYQGLYAHFYPFISDSSMVEPLMRRAFAIDSTTISLFKAILKASGRKSKDGNAKGGIKSHVQIRLLDELPMNVSYTAGAANDHEFLQHLILEHALTVSIMRQHLMSYFNIFAYLKYPEGLRIEFKKSYPFRKNYNSQTHLVFNTA